MLVVIYVHLLYNMFVVGNSINLFNITWENLYFLYLIRAHEKQVTQLQRQVKELNHDLSRKTAQRENIM